MSFTRKARDVPKRISGESGVFEAHYGSTCPACGEEIYPGERVCYDRCDDVVHEDCKW